MSRSTRTVTGLLVVFVLLGIPACDEEQPASSDVPGNETALDVFGECAPTCVETYALVFDFENECLPTNNAEFFLGCLPFEHPCESSAYAEFRSCYISPDHDAIIIWTIHVFQWEILEYIKSQLGWVNCEDVFEYVPEEFENMFPVCE